MALRLYLFGLYSIMFLSLGLWFLLLFNVNPFTAPTWIVIVFYLTLFLFLVGIFAIVGFYFKVWASNREIIFSHLAPTLRQSALISLLIIGLIFLEQVKALNWWVAILLVAAVIMLELFFRSRK